MLDARLPPPNPAQPLQIEGLGQGFVERINPLRHRGLELSECAFPAGCRLPDHAHRRASFSLMLEGGYVERYGAREIDVRPMTVVFMPAAHCHRVDIGTQDARGLRLEVDGSWLEHTPSGVRLEHTVDDDGGELLWLALRLLAEYRRQDDCSSLAIEGLTLEMLAHVGRHRATLGPAAPPWLKRVTEQIRQELDRPLTVQGLAASVGVHPIHLSRVFRRFHKVSIADYVRRLRIRESCRQLARPDIRLADLALAVGFSDQSQFTRAFKQVLGTTPGRHRERLLRDPAQPHQRAINKSLSDESRSASAR